MPSFPIIYIIINIYIIYLWMNLSFYCRHVSRRRMVQQEFIGITNEQFASSEFVSANAAISNIIKVEWRWQEPRRCRFLLNEIPRCWRWNERKNNITTRIFLLCWAIVFVTNRLDVFCHVMSYLIAVKYLYTISWWKK